MAARCARPALAGLCRRLGAGEPRIALIGGRSPAGREWIARYTGGVGVDRRPQSPAWSGRRSTSSQRTFAKPPHEFAQLPSSAFPLRLRSSFASSSFPGLLQGLPRRGRPSDSACLVPRLDRDLSPRPRTTLSTAPRLRGSSSIGPARQTPAISPYPRRFCSSQTSLAQASQTPAMADREILPGHFRPEGYQIVIDSLDFETWTYQGSVR